MFHKLLHTFMSESECVFKSFILTESGDNSVCTSEESELLHGVRGGPVLFVDMSEKHMKSSRSQNLFVACLSVGVN